MGWIEQARRYIDTLNIPQDANLKECRRIFREKGGHFHGGTYWGRKKWGEATRGFLYQRGLLTPPPKPPTAHLFPADITFPFRERP